MVIRAALERLALLTGRLAWAALWLSAAGLVLMTVVIGWQVFARYVLNDTPHWSEQLSLYLMVWYILLGTAVGVRERFHLGVVLGLEALPPAARRVADLLIQALVAGFGVFMTLYGASIARATWSHTIPTLGLPTGSSYLPFPVAGALIVLFCLEHALNDLAGRTPEIARA